MAISCIDDSRIFPVKESGELRHLAYNKNDPGMGKIHDEVVKGDNCWSKTLAKVMCLGSRMHVEEHSDMSSMVTSGKTGEWA